jgi:OOP family OmpA-OmpF porin
MKRLIVAIAAAGLAGCATPGYSGPAASLPMCMPCTNPCTPTSGCPDATAKAAPAPVPAPVAAAASPTFSPAPGIYVGARQVALSSATPGATIHYTTDGTAPTADSPVYSGPIEVTRNTTIRAMARAPGAPESFLSAGGYVINEPPPPAAAAPPPTPAPAPARVVVTDKKIELKDKIFFDTAKATIKSESHSLLDETAAVLNAHPEVKRVLVEGHTDNRGGAAANQKLSAARAQAVRDYLVGKGVAATRLGAKGFGETQPIADNKTAKGRDTNRRVEFSIEQ